MKRKATATDGQATKDVRFVRNFEHIDGNWPSHIYLDGSYQHVQDIADACIISAKQTHGRNRDIVPIDDPHLSVSKPFVLRKHQIIPFVTRLGSLVDRLHALSVRIPAQYSLLANDNNTRHFIALPVTDHRGKLLELVGLVDEALTVFGQPRYYERPIFHISVASMLAGADATMPDPTELHAVTVKPSATSAAADDADNDSSDWLQIVTQHHSDGSEKSQTANRCRSAGEGGSGSDAVVRSQGGALGLLGNYSSDEDSTPELPIGEKQSGVSRGKRDDTGEDKSVVTQSGGKFSIVIHLTAVVCKIGNRVFRKELRPLNTVAQQGATSAGTGIGSGTGNYGGFAECSGW